MYVRNKKHVHGGFHGPRPHALAAALSLALLPAWAAPVVSLEAAGGATQQLYLDVLLNIEPVAQLVPVERRGEEFVIESAVLERVGVKLPDNAARTVALSTLPDVKVNYDAPSQQLQLSVPANLLPPQRLGRSSIYDYVPAQSSPGVLFNYDVYGTDGKQGYSVAAFTEQRAFGPFGVFSNTGVYRNASGTGKADNGYVRYDTFWRYSDERSMTTAIVGDSVTGGLAWTRSSRIGGVQVKRNFELRPDVITYPLPQFSGEAAVPTSVDLFVDNFKVDSQSVKPGPFTLSTVPYVNGAGEVSVVTTDALGRRVETTVPFYVANTLLREGLLDYTASAGALRRHYGTRSADYGMGYASGSLRYGLSDRVTLEGHSEASSKHAIAGAGANFKIGQQLGVGNAAVAQSHFGGDDGWQWNLGYSFQGRRFGFSTQHFWRDAHYADIGVAGFSGTGSAPRPDRRLSQYAATMGLGSWGSLGAAYIDIAGRDGRTIQLANLSWSRSLWGNSSLYASVTRDLTSQATSAQLSVLIPLENRSQVATSISRNADGDLSGRVNYSRSAPLDGGVGWNVGAGLGGSQYRQADATWNTRYFSAQAGVFGDNAGYTRFANLSGSVVGMEGRPFLTRRVDDAVVLVDTGYPDVPVSYENQRFGTTDANGHLLIASVSSYNRGKYAIDPLNLPLNVSVPQTETHVAVRERSGAVVSFPVRVSHAATVRFVDGQGNSLPRGSMVSLSGREPEAIGWEGEIYLENLVSANPVMVTLPNGASCKANFTFTPQKDAVPTIGPVPCR